MKTQGFKVTIEIICNTESDILKHLSVVRKRIKRELRPNNGFNGHIPDGVDVSIQDEKNLYDIRIEPILK